MDLPHQQHHKTTIVITGATGGLGRVVVDYFINKGSKFIALGRKLPQAFQHHPALHFIQSDLTDAGQTLAAVNEILNQHKKIDALFCLAGGFEAGNLKQTSAAQIHQQIELNFYTAFNVVQPLFHHMMEQQSGRIVLVAAKPAILPAAGKNMVAYGLSKSLLLRLAGYLNAEAGGKNISCTVLIPGTIDTEANRRAMPDADTEKWVKPETIAATLEFLLTEAGGALKEAVFKL